jgi:hypothetical protein
MTLEIINLGPNTVIPGLGETELVPVKQPPFTGQSSEQQSAYRHSLAVVARTRSGPIQNLLLSFFELLLLSLLSFFVTRLLTILFQSQSTTEKVFCQPWPPVQ